MATYSYIRITFIQDMPNGALLAFNGDKNFPYQWVYVRYQKGFVEIGTPTGVPGERSAINFAQAFNIDHNTTGLYQVSQQGPIVEIRAKITGIDFSLFTSSVGTSYVTHLISNYEGEVFSLESLVFSTSILNPACTHYRVTIETSHLTENVSGSVVINDNTANPFSFQRLRGQSFNITLTDEDGQTINIVRSTAQVPKALNVGNFDISINNGVGGAVLTIVPLVDYNLQTIEYSLDDDNWQEENQFTGLLEGEFTLYVRDDFGCSFEYDFSISALNIERLPYFRLPKSNSIRFAERVEWGSCSNYKNEDNTLSCESEVLKPFKHTILMQSCDVVTTQFRSNYSENIVTVIRENGDEQNITVNQMTNNMGVTDKRDARKYNLGNGKTGVYFISGNIYDYVTESVTGTYALNGLLPYWGVVGNIMSLGGLFFQIQDVIFDESVNADVLVIDNVYTGANTTAIAASEYNIENFEEWEFIINFNNYLNETIQIRINSNDDDFTNLVQLSEDINTKTVHEDTLEIKYKNSTNTDLNFSRGLECILRLPYTRIDGEILDESENNKTDTTTILLNATIYNLDRFTFEPIVKQIMRQLSLALSHDTITINGVGYVKNDSLEIDGALEESNLYVVVASMIRTGASFNNQTTESDSIFVGDNTEIIGLIESGTGYVKYK